MIERVRPFTADVAGPDDEEEWAVAAAIVWEEAHEALYEWSDRYTMFDDPSHPWVTRLTQEQITLSRCFATSVSFPTLISS